MMAAATLVGLVLVLNEFLDGFDERVYIGVDVLPLVGPLTILRETEPLRQHLKQIKFLVEGHG